ncbi:MAG TPA: gliding motility-associated C-terminal domain-containing protein, partial [Flavobacteriales bacterium]|nr:gliding motility-associated C-terminal domain-containing protein [Flavobacteriales bacterium]
CENNAPTLSEVLDTCIVAGTTLTLTVTATDPDPLDNLTMNASGTPFADSATFTVPGNGSGNNLTGTFNWATSCDDVSNTDYLITISVDDDDQGNTGPVQIPLSDYESFLIRVIPPQVTGVTANNVGNTIVVNWIPNSGCTGATGYKIYRSNSPIVNTNSCCDGSTATDLGYTLVGTVLGVNASEFIDNSPNLAVGQQYCYVVVLYYNDGSVSCPSDPACDQLQAEFPIMTRVSIDVTDATVGTDTVEWFYPYELDTTVDPYNSGNFYYELYRVNGTPTLIFTSIISSSLPSLTDVYFDTGLNTASTQYTYMVKLWHISPTSEVTFVGQSTNASSVFLTLTPNDNQMGLSWNVNVPWTNTIYEIYRETPTGSGTWTMIDTTSLTTYTDTGLLNGVNYCYRIKSIGSYTAPEIPTPLINWSQEACATPLDMTAPCPPTLEILGDCETVMNTLTWNNPNSTCADDVMSYNIYYAETDNSAYSLIAQVTVNSDTVFYHNNNGSIAGCYYVTAIDSAQYGNESDSSNVVCIDNCPYYWLPNVFTPNGDNVNDLFVPFPYKFIKDIELRIYNRWGNLVFETTDPDIKWDGYTTDNKLLVEGVYYYVCKVNTIRLVGIEPVMLHGFVHLIYDNKPVNK